MMWMELLTHPTIIALALISLIGVGQTYRLHLVTSELENQRHVAELEHASAQAAQARAEALNTEIKAKQEQNNHAIEELHAQHQTAMAAADARLAVAIRHGGLRDPNGTCSPGGAVPAGSGASAVPAATAPAGCQLSGQVASDLQLLARDADRALTFAQECKAYLLRQPGAQNASKTPSAP
jgi:hypothetical protein